MSTPATWQTQFSVETSATVETIWRKATRASKAVAQ
jgi:hypothetical protein